MKTKMKKVIYAGLGLLFATATTFAQTTDADFQIKSKSFFLTGVASYQYQEIKSEKLVETNTFEFAKSGGFFVSDNLMLGALAGYSTSTRKIDDVKQSENNIYSGGVFARYFYTPNKKYSFFNEFSAVYAHGETSFETRPSQTVDVDGIGGGVSIGFVYFITKSFGLQASFAGITYTTASFDEFENSAAQGFTFGGDLSDLRIGAVFKL